MATSSTQNIIDTLGEWFEKAPALPTHWKQVLVRIAPILALVFGVLGALGSLAGLGVLSFLSPFAAMSGMQNYGTGFVTALLWLVSAALMLMAYPGLKMRKEKGWDLLFWSEAVSLLASLLAFSIISGIIWAVIDFYLLFQIKSYFK